MGDITKSLSKYVVTNGKAAFVGSNHKSELKLSGDVVSALKKISRKSGIWYEGDGKDIANFRSLLGPNDEYKGSWDEDFVYQEVDGYPIEFLSGLFSNVKENKFVDKFTDPNISIFKSIIKNQKKARYFTDRSFTSKDLLRFLKYGSEKGKDFVSMSNKLATTENLKNFFFDGERLMWPDNWQNYPNKFGKLAKKFNETRDKAIADEKGVFVVGRDHLPFIKGLLSD
jgi:hypothetical protein